MKLVDSLFQVVPEVLKERGKVKNPWPNLDAISGTILHYYGMQHFQFFTVMFAASRCLGITADYIWRLSVELDFSRPSSISIKDLGQLV